MFNNKTRTFLLFTLILIATIGISAATAADIDNNATDTPVIADTPTPESVGSIQTTDVTNKNTQITKNTKENVKNEGEGTFANLANDISSSDVTLSKNYVQESGEGSITIDGDKTIDGAGHTLSQVTNGTFIIPVESTVTLKNLEIYAGETTGKNVIELNGKLTCENVTFDMGNSARASSSIIYFNTKEVPTITSNIMNQSENIIITTQVENLKSPGRLCYKIEDLYYLDDEHEVYYVPVNEDGNYSVILHP